MLAGGFALLLIAFADLVARIESARADDIFFCAAAIRSALGRRFANGHTVAIAGHKESDRNNVLWIYEPGSQEATSLANTEGANFPFWSPDGGSIGFFANGKLKKMSLAGGPVQTLCDASTGRGGAWNKDGVILFTPSGTLGVGLYRISAVRRNADAGDGSR